MVSEGMGWSGAEGGVAVDVELAKVYDSHDQSSSQMIEYAGVLNIFGHCTTD